MQSCASNLCRSNKIAFIAQKVVQTRRKIIAHFNRFNQNIFPSLADDSTTVGHANHQCLGTCCFRLLQGHFGKTKVCATAGQAQLTDRVLRTPVSDTNGDFCRQLVRCVAQKQKIRCFDHDALPRIKCCACFAAFRARFSFFNIANMSHFQIILR